MVKITSGKYSKCFSCIDLSANPIRFTKLHALLGELTLTLTVPLNAKLANILNALYFEIQRVESEPDSSGCSYYVVFQFNIEKYRSIDDLRDLTSEQVNKIATAQAIEASILEYNYQFNLAVQTQMSYHELFYIGIVTAVSTAITMGATLGVGKVVELAGSLTGTAAKELSKSASKTLLGLLQPTAGFSSWGVLYTVAKEIGQEVLIDPWIESAVSGMVRRAGGDAMLQMVLSSVAESLRETLTGPFTNLFSSQQSEGASLYEQLDAKYFSSGLKPTVQDVLTVFNEYRTEIEVQIEQHRGDLKLLGGATRAISFVSIALGFTASQFLGPISALVYSTLATYCFSEDISLKDAFKQAFSPIKAAISNSKIGDYVQNNKKKVLGLVGIGALSATMTGLQVLLPSLNLLWSFLPGVGVPITIGMVQNKKLDSKEEIVHYNRWLTDRIKSYLDNLPNRINYLFDPYKAFTKMGSLLGQKDSYFLEQRRLKWAKRVLAQTVLDTMSSSLKQKIEEWSGEFPQLEEDLFKVYSDLISFVDDYQRILNPKPSPRYQMYNHHPNFNRNFFSEITTAEQAYWLGFIAADGYISVEHKKYGDYYRMGIGISTKDETEFGLLTKFCKAVGLNPKYISTRPVRCDFTGKDSLISEIRWGDQEFAQDLIDLGIEYDFVESKGRRVKVATLPEFASRELALAYLLGFYDGDGSKGLNSQDKSIYPTVSSENREFLYQLKNYFGIKSKVTKATVERYDHRRDIIVRSTQHRLYLEIPLFKEMMENYGNSLERKREKLERLDHYGVSSTRYFLRQVLKRDLLEAMLEIISPNKIGKILGVKGETIARFARDEYGLSIPKTAGEYQSIQHSLRNLRVDSEYYADYFHYTNFLGGLRRGSQGLFGDFNFRLHEYYDTELIKELVSQGIKVDETKSVAFARNRGVVDKNGKVIENPRIIWLTQGTARRGLDHILLRHGEGGIPKKKFSTIFGISDDAETIGNFIFYAITKFPVHLKLPGAGGRSTLYVYQIRRKGEINYLKILVDEEGEIVTAYPDRNEN